MWQIRYSHFLAVVLIGIFVLMAALSVWQKSTTWDEPFHLTAGVTQLQSGDPRLSFDHPPLARLIAALPALFMSIDSVADNMGMAWQQADLISAPNSFLGTIEDRLLWPARLTMLLFSVLLGWLLYLWGTQLFGPIRGLLPLALYAFCPPLLANAPIVATDIPATTLIFASIYTWWRYLQAPDWHRLIWVCLSVAAAFTAKFTALLLVPLLVLLGAITLGTTPGSSVSFTRQLQFIAGGLLLIGLVTILGINLIYFFNGVLLTPAQYIAQAKPLFFSLQIGAEQLTHIWPMWLPVPLPFSYVSGLLAVLGNMADKGHLTYFLGQTGYGGWPNYFLMLLMIKLPIPTLTIIGFGVARIINRLPREWWNILFLMLPPLLLIGVASHGKMQIGIRHILPALPFLFLLAGYAVQGQLKTWRLVIVSVLLILNALSSLTIHPYYLMYFNFLGGGPDQGWRISITGDDWGQGDADLRRWLQKRQIKSLSYLPDGWGGIILGRAGIKYSAPPCSDNGELVAVHVERLLTAVSADDVSCYSWMRLREPDEKIGYSIFLYNSKNVLKTADIQSAQQFQNEGLNLYNAGNYQDSIAANKKSLQFRPDNADVYNNICAAFNNLAQWNAAIEACTQAIKLNPNFEMARNNLAWAQRNAATRK